VDPAKVWSKKGTNRVDGVEPTPYQHPRNGGGDVEFLDQVLDGFFIDTFPDIPPIVQRIPANLKIWCKGNLHSVEFQVLSADDSYRAKTRHRAKRLEKVRTRVKLGKALSEKAIPGTVMTSIGPSWLVNANDELFLCTVSGTVDSPHPFTIVTVGDVVWFEPDRESTLYGQPTGTIVKVAERVTLLSRRAAGRARKEQVLVANVDQLAIVVAAAQPAYHKRLIDRYLIAADKGDLRPLIIVNKVDLIPEEYRPDLVEDFAAYWDDLHIPVLFLSAETGEGFDEFKEVVDGASTLMAGPSGVGKSSIINTLSDARLRVGEISEMYSKGRHTTTAALVIPLPEGGSIVDSPGIREFGMWDLDKDELPYYFDEFAPFQNECRFAPCSHTHEPGCAVKQAVEEGKIDPERYESYVILLEGIDADDPRR